MLYDPYAKNKNKTLVKENVYKNNIFLPKQGSVLKLKIGIQLIASSYS